MRSQLNLRLGSQPAHTSNKWLALALCGLLCMANPVSAQTPEGVLLNQCNVDTSVQSQVTDGAHDEPADCYEFGAAVGDLGLDWRKKLPHHVRWVTREDAASLCTQDQTTFGQKVKSPIRGGCVFLAPAACTIVTAGHVSPASIGNAVRHCAS